MNAIYAVSWAALDDVVEYPLIWDTDNKTVNAFDVTEYYLEASAVREGAESRMPLDGGHYRNDVSDMRA